MPLKQCTVNYVNALSFFLRILFTTFASLSLIHLVYFFMKRFFYIAAAALLICSCGKSKEEAEREAKQKADSIAAVAAAKAAEAAELARLDSIRTDSLARISEFIDAIPTFAEINAAQGSYASLFKKKGFTVTYGRGTAWDNEICEDVPVKTVIANLKLDDLHYCTFKEFLNSNEGCGWHLTIVGAPEKLQEVATATISNMNAQKRQYAGDWYYQEAYARQNGNTITYRFPMGD